jgi:hypothetical protein
VTRFSAAAVLYIGERRRTRRDDAIGVEPTAIASTRPATRSVVIVVVVVVVIVAVPVAMIRMIPIVLVTVVGVAGVAVPVLVLAAVAVPADDATRRGDVENDK